MKIMTNVNNTNTFNIKCWFYFFNLFFLFWFFPKSLDNLDKIATYSICLKLTVCLLLFQISCGGKSCALFQNGEVLNDESSFDRTNKKNTWTTRRDSTLASYVGTLRGQGKCLFAQVLVCQAEQKWVTEERFRGSVAEVCVCVHL